MSPALARWALSVLAILAVGGVTVVSDSFDVDSPWFYIGLALIIVSTVAANGVLREYRTRTLNDEFEAGYRVGYRAGRRAPLSVSTTPTNPTSLSRKRLQKQMNEPSWPDTDDSPPGSTKLR